MRKKKETEKTIRFSIELDSAFLKMMQVYAIMTDKSVNALFVDAIMKRYHKEVEQISSLPFCKSSAVLDKPEGSDGKEEPVEI